MSVKLPVVFQVEQENVLDMRSSSAASPGFMASGMRPVGLVRYQNVDSPPGSPVKRDEYLLSTEGKLEANSITVNRHNEFHYIGTDTTSAGGKSDGAWRRMLPVGEPADYWTDYVDKNLVTAKIEVETNNRIGATDTTGLTLNKEARDRVMKMEAKSLFIKTSDILTRPASLLLPVHGNPTSLDQIQGQTNNGLMVDLDDGINRATTLAYAEAAYDQVVKGGGGLYQAKELIPISVENSLAHPQVGSDPLVVKTPQWASNFNGKLNQDKQKYLKRLGEMDPNDPTDTQADINPYTGGATDRLGELDAVKDVGFLVYDRAVDVIQTKSEIKAVDDMPALDRQPIDVAKKNHHKRRLDSSLLSAGAMVDYTELQQLKVSPYLGASKGGWDFKKVDDSGDIKVFDKYQQPLDPDGDGTEVMKNGDDSINRDYLKYRIDVLNDNQNMISTIDTERANGLSDADINTMIQNLYPNVATADSLADNESYARTRQSVLAEDVNGSLLTAGAAYQMMLGETTNGVSALSEVEGDAINANSKYTTEHENELNQYLNPGMAGVQETVFGTTYYQPPTPPADPNAAAGTDPPQQPPRLPEGDHPTWPLAKITSPQEPKVRNSGGYFADTNDIVRYGLIDQMRLLLEIIGYPVPVAGITKRLTESLELDIANDKITQAMKDAGLTATSSFDDIQTYVINTYTADYIAPVLPQNPAHETYYMTNHTSMFKHFDTRIKQREGAGPSERNVQVWLRSDDARYVGPDVDLIEGTTADAGWQQTQAYGSYRRVFVYFGDLLQDVIGYRSNQQWNPEIADLETWENKLFSTYDNDLNWSVWDYTIQLTSGGRNDEIDTNTSQVSPLFYRNKAKHSFEILVKKRNGDDSKDIFQKIDFVCTAVNGIKAAGTIWINVNKMQNDLLTRTPGNDTNGDGEKMFYNTGYYRILGGDNGKSGAQPILSAAEKYAYMSIPALRSFKDYGFRHQYGYSYTNHRRAYELADFQQTDRTYSEAISAFVDAKEEDEFGGAAVIDFRRQFQDTERGETAAEDMQHWINEYLTSTKPHRVPMLQEDDMGLGTYARQGNGTVERLDMSREVDDDGNIIQNRIHKLNFHSGYLWP